MHRIFSESGFAGVLRAGDSRRFKVNLKIERGAVIKEAIRSAADTTIGSTKVFRTRVRDRSCVSIKDYSHNLILRSISKYLGRKFKVFPRNRDSIVREIIETLRDSTPMYVIRRDIASFYESLKIDGIKDVLEYDAHIPHSIRRHIRAYFDRLCPATGGVPRGVGMSSVIAELVMREADQKIREIPGVYKYFRYSDDILIFAYDRRETVYQELIQTIKDVDLRFNQSKATETALTCPDKISRKTVSFEYLGYKFSMHDGYGDDKPRKVTVSHCDRKIARIKSRVILSFKRYRKDKDFDLLLDRIRFLSSNFYVYRNGTTLIKTSPFVRSGIFYNYPLCGEYLSGKRHRGQCHELKSLDGFYQSLLSGNGSEFRPLFKGGAHASRLSELKRISFYKGFDRKMTVRYRPERVQQIKEAWRNA
ncbi:antiviral reverse transcriptase Drt3a [Caballeronia sp. ATUFL_M1_KS5A]|uniref:antiviral reverse transcriptase Drt3a n=1 Tax=Caballeronia sp. ATUFL_M1_KS5A TaxID=2921778 RepID=UPI0032EC58B0